MKILSFTSGKGGVGKTSITTNIAFSLAQKGRKVLILDGDLGMANVDIFFGVHPQKNLNDLIQGEPLKNCLTSVAQNVDLLAGGSGLYQLCNLSSFQRREIINQISELNYIYDYLLIDTSPGLHDYVLHLNSIADECILILTHDPSSFTDAYALMKVLFQKYKTQKFSIICNQVKDEKQAEQIFSKFSEVAQQFLPVRLSYLKGIPFDPMMRIANQHQRLILRQDTKSISSLALVQIATEIDAQTRYNESQHQSVKKLDAIFGPVSGHA